MTSKNTTIQSEIKDAVDSVFQKMINGYAFSEKITDIKYLGNTEFVHYIKPTYRSKFILCSSHKEGMFTANIHALRLCIDRTVFIVAIDVRNEESIVEHKVKSRSYRSNMHKLKMLKEINVKSRVFSKIKEIRTLTSEYVRDIVRSLKICVSYGEAKNVMFSLFKSKVTFKHMDEINRIIQNETKHLQVQDVIDLSDGCVSDFDETDSIDDILQSLPSCVSDLTGYDF